MFRCVAAIPNTGGSCVEHFYPDTEEGRASAESFAQQYNRDGWGVYDCVSPLKECRRAKDTVAQIVGLHIDLDARNMKENKEQIIKAIHDKLKPFGIISLVNDSGRGVHLYSIFNEPIEAGTPEAERAEQALRRLALHLNADRAPTHFAALMRRVGTMNSKEGGGPCQTIIDTGTRRELFDVEAYLDLVEGNNTLLSSREAPNDAQLNDGPVDTGARLAAMKYEDQTGLGVNATCCAVIPALIWKAWHPADIHQTVLAAIAQMAERDNLKWDMAVEEKKTNERVLAAYHNLFEREYDPSTGVIPVWLPPGHSPARTPRRQRKEVRSSSAIPAFSASVWGM